MSDTNYLEMIEVPVNSCDVIVKPAKRKKKTVVDEVIEKVNKTDANSQLVKRRAPKLHKTKISEPKTKKVKKPVKVASVETETVSVKSSKFDIISVQVVAIFALIIGIILTNIFWEDSGMNNLMRQVFGSSSTKNTAVYSSFSPCSPSKSEEVVLNEGVMTVKSGTIYAPCDGTVDSIIESDGKYTVTVRHSDTFTSIISGIELCYLTLGESVYTNIPLGSSSAEMNISMFDSDTVLTSYVLNGNEIVWLI